MEFEINSSALPYFFKMEYNSSCILDPKVNVVRIKIVLSRVSLSETLTSSIFQIESSYSWTPDAQFSHGFQEIMKSIYIPVLSNSLRRGTVKLFFPLE